MDLFLFIDNSNLFIEMQRVAQLRFNYSDSLVRRVRVDYGRLLEYVKNDRDLKEAILVGSRPPPNDSLWARLKQLGIGLKIYERSVFTDKEREVDQELVNCIRDTMEVSKPPGVIALVSGDGGYVTTLERCVTRGWTVETYFWSQAAASLKQLGAKMKERGAAGRANFFNLNPDFERITFKEPSR
ncbi:MAG: hypothetical protein DMG27_21670 [Acidobacteria bacterium]|nr:MAG: hypothetical protein DMG27_21670 [Acidobacteriota bacterium]